jgi:hypothetical protein
VLLKGYSKRRIAIFFRHEYKFDHRRTDVSQGASSGHAASSSHLIKHTGFIQGSQERQAIKMFQFWFAGLYWWNNILQWYAQILMFLRVLGKVTCQYQAPNFLTGSLI